MTQSTNLITKADTLEEVRAQFSWNIPERYNIAFDVCDRWAETHPHQTAIIHDFGDDQEWVNYGQLKARSNQLCRLLEDLGVQRRDRVAILLPQDPWTAIAHISAFKMGAISVPLFTLFGPQALQYRLHNSRSKVVITNRDGAGKLSAIKDQLVHLQHILCIDCDFGGHTALPFLVEGFSTEYEIVDTHADDPALIIYTSGTTGDPKGALHAHRIMPGHLPGVEISHDFFPQPGDKIWTPADWAWIGGLFDVLMPALYHAVPVVSRRFEKFTGKDAFALINKHGIRNAFLPPTALKMMRMAQPVPETLKSPMRSIASAGESLGAELLAWGKDIFGLWINEFYGQTECNMIISCCGSIVPPVPGVMGHAVPGHEMHVIDSEGRILPPGEPGDIAVKTPDPVLFSGYWNEEEMTKEKFRGDWLITGDQGVSLADGCIRFVGRNDDVITSSGYRIGPGEIENCLLEHPAVAMAGVVGKPDELRTEIIKAFIKLNPGFEAGDALVNEIKQWVKTRLSAHEYPREIAFIDDFPLTATGKIIRRKLRKL